MHQPFGLNQNPKQETTIHRRGKTMSSKTELVALELQKGRMLDPLSERVDDDDDGSSVDIDSTAGNSMTFGSNSGGSNGEGPPNAILGETETRLVTGSKIMMFLVLLIATAGCAFGTYWFTEAADRTVFEQAVSCPKWLIVVRLLSELPPFF